MSLIFSTLYIYNITHTGSAIGKQLTIPRPEKKYNEKSFKAVQDGFIELFSSTSSQLSTHPTPRLRLPKSVIDCKREIEWTKGRKDIHVAYGERDESISTPWPLKDTEQKKRVVRYGEICCHG
jgi:hypothetical protein